MVSTRAMLIGAAAACWCAAGACGAPEFTERVVDPSIFAATGVVATDIDGDGDADILLTALSAPGVVWYENTGATAPTFVRRMIPLAAPGARALAAADLDSDGDQDLIVSARVPERLVWLEQVVGAPGAAPMFEEREMWAGANGARRINLIDFDGDGDPDVVAAGQFGASELAWIENVGAVGAPRTFVPHVIPCAQIHDLSSAAGDVDGDGDVDVVVTRSEVFGNGWVGWMENIGPGAPGGLPEFVAHELASMPGGEHNASVWDLDSDGDADIVCASFHRGEITWFENVGPAAGAPAFERRTIAPSAAGASEVVVIDVDGDQDWDVLTAMYHDGEVRWHERTATGWVSHLLRDGSLNAEHVSAADIDGDGDMDPVAALFNSVTWYDNGGPACPGDANGDGAVNFADVNLVLSNFGAAGAPGIPGDLDGDGVVGFADLNEVLSFFGAVC